MIGNFLEYLFIYFADGRQVIMPNAWLSRQVLIQYQRSKNYVLTLFVELGISKKIQVENFRVKIHNFLKEDKVVEKNNFFFLPNYF